MATPTITDYLKYANLQMAAEAFLVRNDGTVRDDIVAALLEGNKHALRFARNNRGRTTGDRPRFVHAGLTKTAVRPQFFT